MSTTEARKIVSLYRNLSILSKLHIYIRLRRLPFEIVEKFVPKKGKILDFGCGHGFFSLYMSMKSKEREIIGVDISKKKIDTASFSKHNKNISFKYNLETTSFLQKKFCYNAIVILNVLYLLQRSDQEMIIKKASEALGDKGKLLLIEPDANLKLRIFSETIREFIMLRLLRLTKGVTITYNTREWWIKTLKKYYKKVEYIQLSGKKHHLLFICTK